MADVARVGQKNTDDGAGRSRVLTPAEAACACVSLQFPRVNVRPIDSRRGWGADRSGQALALMASDFGRVISLT